MTLIINALAYNTHTTTKIKISLLILLGGVGVAVRAPRRSRRGLPRRRRLRPPFARGAVHLPARSQ